MCGRVREARARAGGRGKLLRAKNSLSRSHVIDHLIHTIENGGFVYFFDNYEGLFTVKSKISTCKNTAGFTRISI